MEILDLLLKMDAPAVTVVAMYLWSETKRLHKSNESLRSELSTLNDDFRDYIEQQTDRWHALATTVRQYRKSHLKERSENYESG